ncbi:M13 family metallopeptidase [Aquimarina litoralis]|uniref:M13 family metallopeptidase n=1 Tax=Aquimarina litoralis TaxID=584605 RepID=UPI001C5906C8|nr:M13 family metallopeptidase [Aquimarina litoralis]MBW1297682.1 M13 family peptidase [Aquimarina litoralis]
MRKVYFLVAFAIAFVSCKNETKKEGESQEEPIAVVEKIPGIVLDNMDTSISPKEDFYNYVNGNWMKNTEIPEDRTRWGGFGVLRKKTDYDVLDILAKAKASGKYAAGTDQYKAILIYESIMDTIARDKAGITPIKPTLDKIAGIKNLKDLQTVLATEPAASAPFAGLVSFPNLSNSEINAPYISPGGLGLPDRDYYLDQDEKSKEVRAQYVDHITRMLQYIGETEKQARQNATTILAIETKLAEPRLDKVESRDTRNFNNPRSITQLTEMTPSIDWNKLMKDLEVKKQLDSVIVMQPKYMKELQNVLANTGIEDLKTVMRWATLNDSAGTLSMELEKANWDFYSKTLNGAIKQRPLKERALARVNGSVGEAIGQLYVDEKFPPEAKAKAEKMIANVIKAYQKRIEVLDWMSDSTKTKAIQKLDKFTVKIGYPDEWEDYSTLDVKDGNSYFDNMIAVSEWGFKKNINEIGEPVDKTEWGMSPQTVNAYFNPLFNEIVFPAAILQPPFYNYTADEAVNYGGIGAVIGHEISHAFDDSGARFDADGNLSNWWTDVDLEKFTERGTALADQYSKIQVLDSVFINGKFTLGENIGDLGGVLGAYDGLQMHLAENGRPEDIDGFTPEQRFFMSWATVWRTKIREDALRTQIKTDPHSPGTTRAIQPLLNVQAFYDAFDIKEGDSMYLAPEKRVSIW